MRMRIYPLFIEKNHEKTLQLFCLTYAVRISKTTYNSISHTIHLYHFIALHSSMHGSSALSHVETCMVSHLHYHVKGHHVDEFLPTNISCSVDDC